MPLDVEGHQDESTSVVTLFLILVITLYLFVSLTMTPFTWFIRPNEARGPGNEGTMTSEKNGFIPMCASALT